MLKDSKGSLIETTEQVFLRVAKNISKEEEKYSGEVKKWEKSFFKAMSDLEFIPNLPTFTNAGRELQQLAACFVLPVEDSIEGIFQSVKDMAIIQKTGGGTGFSFSRLRPEGSRVKETGGVASGPVSFMHVFDCGTAAIKEGGIRRGANMGVLSIDHPDIEKFISCKDSGDFSNFNISVAITDEFMKSVVNDASFELKFKNQVYKKLNARKFFHEFSKHSWLTGDPGVLFIDTINKANPTPKIGKIESTNPCGEQPLLPYESCILGSINLEKCVKNKKIDFEKLEQLIHLGVRFLDDCIDASSYPLKQIEETVKKNRKIGLGVMGFANMLILLGVSYNSQKAIDTAEELMKFFQQKAREASEQLAKERGVFPNYPSSIWNGKRKLRNATITTIAPTGTIAIIADTSAGIEPLFAVIYERDTTFGKMLDINSLFKEKIKKYHLSNKVLTTIARRGDLKKSNLSEEIKDLFITAHQIPPSMHIKIQAIFQKYTDNAVSKTVNLPETATIEDIKKCYFLSWNLKCKGTTVYRYGSKKNQVLSFINRKKFNFFNRQ